MKNTKKNLNSARGVVYNCNYHIVFSTKYRTKVFTPLAYKYGFEVAQIEVGERDPVHISMKGL